MVGDTVTGTQRPDHGQLSSEWGWEATLVCVDIFVRKGQEMQSQCSVVRN